MLLSDQNDKKEKTKRKRKKLYWNITAIKTQ